MPYIPWRGSACNRKHKLRLPQQIWANRQWVWYSGYIVPIVSGRFLEGDSSGHFDLLLVSHVNCFLLLSGAVLCLLRIHVKVESMIKIDTNRSSMTFTLQTSIVISLGPPGLRQISDRTEVTVHLILHLPYFSTKLIHAGKCTTVLLRRWLFYPRPQSN